VFLACSRRIVVAFVRRFVSLLTVSIPRSFQWRVAHGESLESMHACARTLLRAINDLEMLSPIEYEIRHPQVD
jgi:hypothetical protein